MQDLLKSNDTKAILHEGQYTFWIISRSFIFRMRNVSDKSCRENQNTYFAFNNLSSENRAVYEIMWVQYF